MARASYLKIKKDAYLAIINEERMVEINAKSLEEAKEKAESVWDGDIRVCRIPDCIFCL